MAILSLNYAILFRGVWEGHLMKNALYLKKISKLLAREFTTSISSDGFNREIELIFNKSAKINKYIVEFRFYFDWKHPAIYGKVIDDYNIIFETYSIKNRRRTPQITVQELKRSYG